MKNKILWLLLILVSIMLRFAPANHAPWLDETETLMVVNGEIPPENLYHRLAKLVEGLFSEDQLYNLRYFSQLTNLITVLLFYFICVRLCPRKQRLIAVALMACSPLYIFIAQDASSSSLLLMVSTAAVYYYLKWQNSQSLNVTGWLDLNLLLYTFFSLASLLIDSYGLIIILSLLAVHYYFSDGFGKFICSFPVIYSSVVIGWWGLEMYQGGYNLQRLVLEIDQFGFLDLFRTFYRLIFGLTFADIYRSHFLIMAFCFWTVAFLTIRGLVELFLKVSDLRQQSGLILIMVICPLLLTALTAVVYRFNPLGLLLVSPFYYILLSRAVKQEPLPEITRFFLIMLLVLMTISNYRYHSMQLEKSPVRSISSQLKQVDCDFVILIPHYHDHLFRYQFEQTSINPEILYPGEVPYEEHNWREKLTALIDSLPPGKVVAIILADQFRDISTELFESLENKPLGTVYSDFTRGQGAYHLYLLTI